MNKSCLSICMFVVLTVSGSAFGQSSSRVNSQHFDDMVRQIDQRASSLQKPALPQFNFESPKIPNPFEKLKDFKMPKFGLMDKLKGMGSAAAAEPTSRPILDGLAKLFPPPSVRKGPSLWERMTGGGNESLLPETQRLGALNELNEIARGYGQQAGQAAQDLQNGFGQGMQNGMNRFSKSVIPGPKPPLRSAREGYGSSSRY